MQTKLTRITSRIPEILTKRFDLVGGELVKTASAHMTEGRAEVLEIESPQSFADLLLTLGTNQALTFGTPDYGDCEIVTRDEWHRLGQPKDKATRTNDHFHYAPGPGIMMIDYDPTEGVKPYDRDELLAALEFCCNGITAGGWVWMPSSSSFIYDDLGRELNGLQGQRLYLFVQSAADIPRAGEVLAERMWLKGFGRIEISKAGSRLVRSVIDASVFQPSRLDFASGAECGAGLEQRRGMPVVQHGDAIDSVHIVKHGKVAEGKQAKQIIADAVEAASGEANRVRVEYVKSRAKKEAGSRATPEQIERAVERITKALETDDLETDFIVYIKDGGAVLPVSVGHILADPKRYHAKQCLDPAEPGYRGTQPTGIIYSDSDRPNIYSLAHGGRVFRLIDESEQVDPFEPKTYNLEVHCLVSGKGERIYYWREGDRYIPVSRADAPTHLLRYGVPDEVLPNGIKLTDEILLKMQMDSPLTFAGEIAGYDAGVHQMNNAKVLCTSTIETPQPVKRDWSTLGQVMSGLFPDADNRRRFMAACYFYWRSLHRRQWMPLPILVLCGPRECGKTLAVSILNMMMGEKPHGKGYRYLCGETAFNADLLKSVLLVCDDEATAKDMRSRMGMAAAFKQFSVDNKHRIEPKGFDAFTCAPHWRVIVCCNDEAEHMQVLPPVDESLADKFLLLRACRNEMPMDTNTPEGRETFEAQLKQEIPGFLWAMENETAWLNEYGGKRMQIEGWQDPVLLQRLNGLSNEIGLLELIDMLDPWTDLRPEWIGTAAELEAELTENEATRHKARSLLGWSRACGTYLSRLCTMEPGRVSVVDQQYSKHAKVYKIVQD